MKYLNCLSLFLFVSTAVLAAIDIPTALVRDAGNANDSSTGNLYGGVSYAYHIGTYEVTNNQYAAFLNNTASTDTHSLYNTSMSIHGITRSGSSGSYSYTVNVGFGDKPVNYVSFWDAARFSNWLTTGGTETGVYNLNGTTVPTNNTITRDAAAWANGGVAVASENEWYKAAYYDGNGGYTLYPTQSNSITTADANYANSVGTVTDVGTYSSDPSHYGTFDQGGNVWEWNDAIVSTSDRGLRGGSELNADDALRSSAHFAFGPTNEIPIIGFRVSSLAPIPEPSTYAAILGSLALAIAIVRRKGRGTL